LEMSTYLGYGLLKYFSVLSLYVKLKIIVGGPAKKIISKCTLILNIARDSTLVST